MQASLGIFLFVAGLVGSIQTAPTKPCAALGLLERIDPKAYYSHLVVDMDNLSYRGVFDVSFTVDETKMDEPKNVIALNADKDIAIDYSLIQVPGRVIKVKDTCRDDARQLVVFTFFEDLADKFAGNLTLIISGKVRDDGSKGIYAHKPTNEDNSLVKADFSNYGARIAVPCLDEPKYETKLELGLLTSHDLIATSSSLEISKRYPFGDATINKFKMTPPMQIGKVSFEIRPKPKESV